MSYWEMDDGFLGHHKTRRAVRSGWEALGMWVALRTYTAKFLTDGFIPDEEIDALADAPNEPRKWLRVLIECGRMLPNGTRGPGLVEEVTGGFCLHDYSDHCQSAAHIKAKRKAARERQNNWRAKRAVTRDETRDETRDNARDETRDGHGLETRDETTTNTNTNTNTNTDPDPEGETRATVPRRISTGAKRFAASFETTAPDSLEFTEEHREFQGQLGIDLQQIWLECRDYRRARKEKREDWAAEFTSWLRKEVRIIRERHNGAQSKAKTPPQRNDETNRYVPPRVIT